MYIYMHTKRDRYIITTIIIIISLCKFLTPVFTGCFSLKS